MLTISVHRSIILCRAGWPITWSGMFMCSSISAKEGRVADGLAPQVKVALDVAHSAVVPSVTALLYYGVGVALKGRDEPFLAEKRSGLDGVVPESKGVPGSE